MKHCFVVLIAVSCFLGPSVGATENDSDRIKVFASIVPQAFFVKRVGGDLVDVGVLVGPGQEPHRYEPTPKQMAALSKAKALFRIGVPFEDTLLPKIMAVFKNLKVVDTRRGIRPRIMTRDECTARQVDHGKGEDRHKEKGEQEHRHRSRNLGTPDPHLWLDPVLVKVQAANICNGLIAVDPDNADEYRKNLKAFQEDLDRVNNKIARELAPLKGKEFFVFHPAFGYFGDRYGLKQVAVEIGGKQPTARQLARLITMATNDGVKVIFVQPEFSTKSAELVAKAIGGAVVPMDPLAPDYIKNLEEMATKIGTALKGRAN